MRKSCKHQDLLKNSLCKINYCAECDSVNLMLGAMTLHLTVDQFEQLSDGFRQAIERKNSIDQPQDHLHKSLNAMVH